MTAVYKREIRAYFTSFTVYCFFAVFFLVEAILFNALYKSGSVNIYAIPFSLPLYCTLFLVPLLTMRTISEDKRQKVDQALLTSPVSIYGIVMGKFLACLTVYAVAYVPTLIFQLISSYLSSSTNWLYYLYAMFGTLLFGAVIIAIGIFVSSITESTVLAAILSIFANIVAAFISGIAELINVSWLTKASEYIAIVDRYNNFSYGILNIADIVYFVSIIAVFLFFSGCSIEKRRWA